MELTALRRLRSLKEAIVLAAHTTAVFSTDLWLDAVQAIRSIVRGTVDTMINNSVWISNKFKSSLLLNLAEGVTELLLIETYGYQRCKEMRTFYAPPKPVESMSLSECFMNCTSLLAVELVGSNPSEGYGTSNVIGAIRVFDGCARLRAVDTENWDTSNMTSMSYMFQNCKLLTNIKVGSWVTSSVTNMSYLFSGCSSLTSLDVSGWDVSSVTNMSYMFQNCSSLTSLDLSSWSSRITSIYATFARCSLLTSIDLSSLDLSTCSAVRDAFSYCYALTSVKGFSMNALYGIKSDADSVATYTARVAFTATELRNLTEFILEGTLYRGVSITRVPNMDVPSLKSWFEALYDWTTNPEDMTSYEVEYDENDEMIQQPNFTVTPAQMARLEAAKTSLYDGAAYHIMLATMKGFNVQGSSASDTNTIMSYVTNLTTQEEEDLTMYIIAHLYPDE